MKFSRSNIAYQNQCQSQGDISARNVACNCNGSTAQCMAATARGNRMTGTNNTASHLVWSEILDDAGENGFATHRDCEVVQRFAKPG